MKKDIHPPYYPGAKITCVCGNTFTVGSTLPSYEVEICSACHPFYTGKEKMIDTAGRVERFRRRVAQKSAGGVKKKVRIRKPRIEEIEQGAPAIIEIRRRLVQPQAPEPPKQKTPAPKTRKLRAKRT